MKLEIGKRVWYMTLAPNSVTPDGAASGVIETVPADGEVRPSVLVRRDGVTPEDHPQVIDRRVSALYPSEGAALKAAIKECKGRAAELTKTAAKLEKRLAKSKVEKRL